MKILERKQTRLSFVDVKVDVKAGLNIITNHIFFDNEDDMNKVYNVLCNHEAFANDYNVVSKKVKNNNYIVTLVGEIVIKYNKNILSLTIYNNWEEL